MECATISALSPSPAMRWMALATLGETDGSPASIMSTPTLVEHPRNLDLFIDGKVDIRRLFAFAQGGIQDFDHDTGSFS